MGLYEGQIAFQQESTFNDRLWPVAYADDPGLYYLFPSCSSTSKAKVHTYMGFGYISHPMTGCDDGTVAKLNAMLSIAFPKDSFLQFMLMASPDIHAHLTNMKGLREGGSYFPVLDDMMTEKAQHIQSGTTAQISRRMKALVRDFVVVITAKIPIAHPQPTQEEFALISDIKIALGQTLETIGLAATALTPELYLRFMGTILNWEQDAYWRVNPEATMWDKARILRDQVKDPAVNVQLSGEKIMLGKKLLKCLTPRKLPQFHSLGQMSRFIGDPMGARGVPGNFAISLVVRFMDDAETKTKLAAQRSIVNYQAFGPMLKWAPQLAARKNSFDVLFAKLDKGDRAVQIYPAFLVFADDEEHLTAAVSNMMAYYRELGWVLQHDNYIQLVTFLNHLPFNADPEANKFLGRYGTVSTSQAAEFVPIIADWKGTGTPAITLFSRNAQPMSIDLYDSNSNFNAVISASSGSGKSFFMNEIVASYLSMPGSQFWMIDVGESYKNLCEVLGGSFIEFSEEAEVSLNPFKMIKDFDEDGEMVVGIMVSMAQENEKLDDVQLTTLRHVLSELWSEYGNETTIDLVAEILRKSEDQRIVDVGQRLYPFTMSGPYGKYFHGEPNVDFTNRLTVLELQHLKGRPTLQRVVLLMLVFQVSSAMYVGNLDRRKFLVIDEAWELLSHPSVASFIEGLYRKARKARGSAIIVTQAMTDLYASKSGEAIAANSAHKYLLAQTPEVISTLQRDGRLSIGEWGFDQLRSVHTIKGEYSEIFCYTNYGMGVGRLIVDRFSQLLYSTDPDDRRAISRRTDKGMSTTEAIRDIVKLETEHGHTHKEIERE